MIGFYPEQTQAFSLPIHSEVPEPKRPRFFARYLTPREAAKVSSLATESVKAEATGDTETACVKLDEALGVLLASKGENWPEKFAPVCATHFLMIADAWDLYAGAIEAIRLGRDDLKKSASPSKLDSASTASIAPPPAGVPAVGEASSPTATV